MSLCLSRVVVVGSLDVDILDANRVVLPDIAQIAAYTAVAARSLDGVNS